MQLTADGYIHAPYWQVPESGAWISHIELPGRTGITAIGDDPQECLVRLVRALDAFFDYVDRHHEDLPSLTRWLALRDKPVQFCLHDAP